MINQDNRSQWVSERFIQFVDIVFGVVVAQGFVRYFDLIINPGSSWFAFCVLVSAYIVIILSWIGYHQSISRYPYEVRTVKAWIRMFFDFLVVSVYARLLFSIADFKAGAENARLDNYLWNYPLIFGLYLLSGFTRIWEKSDKHASRWGSLLILGFFYGLLLMFYKSKANVSACFNWLYLGIYLLTYIGYRCWRQHHYEISR